MIPFEEITRLVRQSEELGMQIRQAVSNLVYVCGGKITLECSQHASDTRRETLLIKSLELHNGKAVALVHRDHSDDYTVPVSEISPGDLLGIVHSQTKELTEKRQKQLMHDLACELALDHVSDPERDPEGYARACFGHYDRLSTLHATGERNICAVCGTTQVSCEAHINPNTQEFIEYGDEAFYHAHCTHCYSQILVDVVALHSDIDARYNEFIRTHGSEPQLACCRVVNTDRDPVDDDSTYTTHIYLSTQGACDSGELRCDGIEGLKSLAFPDEDRPFTLLECSGFLDYQASVKP